MASSVANPMMTGAAVAQINGVCVPVTTSLAPDTIPKALASSLFVDWVASLEPAFVVSSVEIQSIDFFGPRVGFLKILVAATCHGKPVPGVIFLRGGAVAILPILTCRGERWVVCTRQPRIASGVSNFLEIPAGMLDGSGRFTSVAATEMREETGIEIQASELQDLTALAYEGGSPHSGTQVSPFSSKKAHAPGVFPSVGACDEFIRLMLYTREVSEQYLAQLRGRLTGNAEEHENITVQLFRYEDVWRAAPDMKTLSAMFLYQKLSEEGCLTPHLSTRPLASIKNETPWG